MKKLNIETCFFSLSHFEMSCFSTFWIQLSIFWFWTDQTRCLKTSDWTFCFPFNTLLIN